MPADPTLPSIADAKARRRVQIIDGGQARLLSVPIPHRNRKSGRSQGSQARVILPSGAIVSYPLDALILIPEGVES